jgi:hypothetical protein
MDNRLILIGLAHSDVESLNADSPRLVGEIGVILHDVQRVCRRYIIDLKQLTNQT